MARLARNSNRLLKKSKTSTTSKTTKKPSKSSTTGNTSSTSILDKIEQLSSLKASKQSTNNCLQSSKSSLQQSNTPNSKNCLQSDITQSSIDSKRKLLAWKINTNLTLEEIAVRKLEFLATLYETGGKVIEACRLAGIGSRQAYQWKKDDLEFENAWNAVREHRLDLAEQALDRLVQKGQPSAIIFLLKTQGKKRGYIERLQLENKTPKDKDLTADEVTAKLKQLNGQLDKLNSLKKSPALLLSSSVASNPDSDDVDINPDSIN